MGLSVLQHIDRVSAGAVVTGSQALLLERDPNNAQGGVVATLTNAGTLTGTAGAALVTGWSTNGINLSVTNLAGGTIVGMWGQIDTLTSGDLVNAAGGTAFSGNGGVGIINTGQIVSNGGTAITAISARATNSGAITASGGTAITVAETLRLTNSGTITGAVVARGGSSFQGSTIDTLAGTIDGSLTLGTGNDTLLARYDAGRLVTGITGAIDGGAGVDTLRIGIAADTTLGGVALPTRFERLGLALAGDVTVTLDGTFGAIGGLLQIEGSGTVMNQGTLTGNAPVVSDGTIIGSPAFINAGAIRTTGGDAASYAVDLRSARLSQNDGEVTASGNGVAFGGQAFINAGSITAAGIAVRAYGSSFANSGTI